MTTNPVKWSAFSSGSAIADSDTTVGLQSGGNVKWAMSALKTYLLGAANAVLAITAAKTVTHTATTTFAGTDGKTLTVSNSGTLAGGDAFTLAIAAGKTLTASNTLTLAGTDSTTMTFPSTSATIARTDAANTFTGASTATSWNLVTPVLGTPSSGNLSSCTAYPFSSLTGSASVAQMGSTTYASGSIEFTQSAINFNSANSDTAFAISLPTGYTRYLVSSVFITGASTDLSAATQCTCGVFTSTGGGGTTVVTSGTAVTVSSTADATNANTQLMNAVNANTQSYTLAGFPTLYFRVQTAHGSAATASVTIQIRPMP